MARVTGTIVPDETSRTPPAATPPPGTWRWGVRCYLLFVLIPMVVAGLVVWHTGRGGAARGGTPAARTGTGGTVGPIEFYKVFLAVAVIILCCHAAGTVMRRLGQPPVIGEMLLGILMGPSLFGALCPGIQVWLFTPGVVSALNVLAQFGVVFFMFAAGLHMPLGLLRRRLSMPLVIGHTSLAVPMLSGVILGTFLWRSYKPAGAGLPGFIAFFGLTLSITAFPVLARVLAERRLSDTLVGTLAMATAAVSDVTAWCLIAVTMAVTHGGSLAAGLRTVALTVLFAALMYAVVRPALAAVIRALESRGRQEMVAVVVVITLLGSAVATDRIGVHAIFGAFTAGLIMPRDALPVLRASERLDAVTSQVMLPLFFVTVGLRVHLGGLGSGKEPATFLLILLVSLAGKYAGSTVPLLWAGMRGRDSVGVGAMMSCRGLTELIVLDIGLSSGILSPKLFSMLVLMAVTTTVLTGVTLALLRLRGDTPATTAMTGRDAGATAAS